MIPAHIARATAESCPFQRRECLLADGCACVAAWKREHQSSQYTNYDFVVVDIAEWLNRSRERAQKAAKKRTRPRAATLWDEAVV